MKRNLLQWIGSLLFLATMLAARQSASFEIKAINTSNRVDGDKACGKTPATAVVSDVDITNGKCTGVEAKDIPLGNLSHISSPEVSLRINQYYNNNTGHNGLDVDGPSTCPGVNDVHAILQGRVLVSMSEKQTGGSTGWGESTVVATRANDYSEEIITHAYHHMHNHGTSNHPEDTTRRKNPCDLVSLGEALGKEGTTGNSTGSHLHLTIRRWKNMAELSKAVDDFAQGKTGPLFGNAYPGHNNKALARNLDPQGLLFDTFTDVEAGGASGWAVGYVSHMRHLGVEFGLFDGSYGATQNVKRREAARWLKIASKRALNSSPKQTFKDVVLFDPDFMYIETLSRSPDLSLMTVINPHPPSGNFYPDNEIARAEALKMIIIAFYRDEYLEWYDDNWYLGAIIDPIFSDVEPSDWHFPFVHFGVFEGIVAKKPTFNPSAPVTRAEIAKWIIEGYDHLGELPDFPCGAPCQSGQYCRPTTQTCVDVPECLQNEWDYCDIGGGDSGTCFDGVQNQDETGVDCGGGCPACQSCGDGVCSGSENQASCCQDCQGCPSCTDGQTMSCGYCGTSTCSGDQYGPCQMQGVCSPGDVQNQTCNGNGTQSRTCDAGCQWGAWSSCVGGCPCPAGGVCCSDGCNFDPQGASCGACTNCDGTGSCSQSKPNGTACGGGNVCTNGACGAPPCGAANYWSPTPASETDSTGTQANATINTPITVEVRETGAGLEARVCKPGGTFMYNIAFSIYDAATNSTVGIDVSNLATAGQTCSAWVGLLNDNGYTEGQQFGGTWQVVSPAGSAGEWGFPYGSCGVNGSPGGTCWSGINITMTRTCK